MTRILGVIGARAGSKRCPGKHLAPLGGKPLIEWTFSVAQEAWETHLGGLVVSSDDQEILDLASGWLLPTTVRPVELARDLISDADWLADLIQQPAYSGFDAIMLLRPTSPFRTVDHVARAVELYEEAIAAGLDGEHEPTVRAVRKVSEPPGKMWQLRPVEDCADAYDPSHQSGWDGPSQLLEPELYIQTGALDLVPTWRIEEGILAPASIVPLILEGPAGIDINTAEDLLLAQAIAEQMCPERVVS